MKAIRRKEKIDKTGWKPCPCRISPTSNVKLDIAAGLWQKPKEEILEQALNELFEQFPAVIQAASLAG